MLRYLAFALALVWLVPAAAQPAAGTAVDATADQHRQDLLYAALCRGVLWPDDRPTQLAADALPADTTLELLVRTGLDAVAAGDPTLGRRLAAEAADGGRWLAETVAAGGAETADHVRAECTRHLEIFAPSLRPPMS